MEGKIVNKRGCVTCGVDFPIYERDRAFYAKMKVYGKYEVPDPVECWDCRQQRRQAQRNERNLYRNKCDKCGKDMLTVFSPDKGSVDGLAKDKKFDVYCSECWWGDGWNPLDYGREFDFSRPFFEQWKELFYTVPKLGLLTLGEMVNSDYVNDAYRLKNCYLVFDGEQAQDCMYGETFVKMKDCVEFLVGNKLELCYETVNCINCYNCRFLKFCNNCSESSFLVDCIGCKNCFACCNLRRAEFCIFNEQYERGEYEKKVASYGLGGYAALEKFKAEFEKFVSAQPKRAYHGVKNEDVSGDCIDNCKDVYHSFDCVDSRDCSYCTNLEVSANDCYDVDVWGENLSLVYNCECAGAGAQNLMCNYYSGMSASNVFYSAFCWNGANDMLGCVALQHKKFCIFNKQYDEGPYAELFGRIVEHMKKTGEWGQFFPISTSWFGYNETVAHEFYPLTREEALKRGYNWKEKDSREFLKQKYVIPDRIEDVPDSICDEVLACEAGGGAAAAGGAGGGVGGAGGCGRNFKITPQELAYYRRFGVPVPRMCYNCRHMARRRLKNPRKLWERKCARSGVPILTSYAPSRPEVVWSAEEYVKEFF